MSPPIAIEPAWLDPLIECMVRTDRVRASCCARRAVSNFFDISPSASIDFINRSGGSFPAPYRQLEWLLRHRAEAIKVDIKMLDFTELDPTLQELAVSECPHRRFLLSHPRVARSIVIFSPASLIIHTAADLALLTALTSLIVVELTLHDVTLSLAPLSTLKKLVCIKLDWPGNNKALPDSVLEPLASLTQLESLYIDGDLTDDAFKPLGLSGALPSLSSLSITRGHINGAFLDHMPSLRTSLRNLRVDGLSPEVYLSCSGLNVVFVGEPRQQDDEDIEPDEDEPDFSPETYPDLLGRFPVLGKVKAMEIRNASLIRRMLDLRDVQLEVEELDLDGSGSGHDFLVATSFAGISCLPALTKLTLQATGFDDDITLDSLKPFTALTRLEELTLGYFYLAQHVGEDEGIAPVSVLANIKSPVLRELELLSDGALDLLNDIEAPPFAASLTSLHLAFNQAAVIPRGFLGLRHLTNLRDVSIGAYGRSIADLGKLTSGLVDVLPRLQALSLKVVYEEARKPNAVDEDQLSALMKPLGALTRLVLEFPVTLPAARRFEDLITTCKSLRSAALLLSVRLDIKPADISEELRREVEDLPNRWFDSLDSLHGE